MSHPLVVHKKFPHDVYCGRPSKWGNPFEIGKDGDRTEVIFKHRAWLIKNHELMAQMWELQDLTLGCWCAPQDCHCDTLAQFTENGIYVFGGENEWLSNFYGDDEGAGSIEYFGTTYATNEHFFQAMKNKDPEYRQAVADLPWYAAGKAKRLGRQVILRPDWDAIKNKVMVHGLRLKFADKYLADKLAATYPYPLTECNVWHDVYWGVCVSSRCRPRHANHYGQNVLGRLLMQVREEMS